MELKPKLIKGNLHTDARGALAYNNDFDLSLVKRMYVIQNISIDIQRGWQGHKIEKRWFNAIEGCFKIKLIKIDDWVTPSSNLDVLEFDLDSKSMDILYVPEGYISCIQSQKSDSKLIVFADYGLGEIDDDYRFDLSQFNK